MKSKLIAICSGTKGIGKTWFAVNLSHSLTLFKKKILFFDADCGLENAIYQLDLNVIKSYDSLLSGSLTINNAITKYDKVGFDIIGSKPGEKALSTAPIGRAQVIAKDLFCFSKYYDSVIIDCSDDDTKTVSSFINICDFVILIVNADQKSSLGAYKKIEKFSKIKNNINIKVIVNRAMSYNEGNQIYNALLKASQNFMNINLMLLGIIRQDARIRDSVLNKSLLLNRYPESEGAEDLVKISQKILEDI